MVLGKQIIIICLKYLCHWDSGTNDYLHGDRGLNLPKRFFWHAMEDFGSILRQNSKQPMRQPYVSMIK